MNENMESMKYQQMLGRVEGIVTELSSDRIDLDEMVEKVEEGYRLIKAMRQRLDDTKMKVEQLRAENSEGS